MGLILLEQLCNSRFDTFRGHLCFRTLTLYVFLRQLWLHGCLHDHCKGSSLPKVLHETRCRVGRLELGRLGGLGY